MSTTIGDISDWVTADYLNRTDIGTITDRAALYFYRVLCNKVPFEEFEVLSSEIPLVVGQDTYDLNTLTPPVQSIIDIRITFSPGNRRRLRRSSSRLFDALSLTNNGKPATYARSTALTVQLNPPPDSASYTIRVRHRIRPTEANPIRNTVLATPIEWDELCRWETAWRVLNMTGQEERAALLIQPMGYPKQRSPTKSQMQDVGIIPRLWNELLTTHSQRENVDEDFSINPVIRPYSVR